MPRKDRSHEPREHNINTQITEQAAKELATVRFGTGRGFLQEFLSHAILEEAARLKAMKAPAARSAVSKVPRWARRLGWALLQDLLAVPALAAAWEGVPSSERLALQERWTTLFLETVTKALAEAPAVTETAGGPG